MYGSHALRNGGPCCCQPGRYVRFTLPAVPGIPTAIVSCRENDDNSRHTIREHAIPPDAHIEVRCSDVR
jgi:hypothetical protein